MISSDCNRILLVLLCCHWVTWSIEMRETSKRSDSSELNQHTNHKHYIQSLENQVNVLRNSVAKTFCHGKEEISSTGAWCLQSDGNFISPDRPLGAGHSLADPELAKFFTAFFSGFRIFDFGAGVGQYGLHFNSTKIDNLPGIDYTGFDGAINVPEFTLNFINWADLTMPFYPKHSPADWVLSLEVGEHVPKEFERNFISNLDHNNLCGIVLSWGIPGQRGKGHVNLKHNSQVVDLFQVLGYEFQEVASLRVRAEAKYRWFWNSFMLFKNLRNWKENHEFCSGSLNKKRHELLQIYLTADDKAANVSALFW